MMLSLRRCSTSATNRRAGCMRSRASTPFVSRQSAALPPVNYKKQSVQKMYFTTKTTPTASTNPYITNISLESLGVVEGERPQVENVENLNLPKELHRIVRSFKWRNKQYYLLGTVPMDESITAMKKDWSQTDDLLAAENIGNELGIPVVRFDRCPVLLGQRMVAAGSKSYKAALIVRAIAEKFGANFREKQRTQLRKLGYDFVVNSMLDSEGFVLQEVEAQVVAIHERDLLFIDALKKAQGNTVVAVLGVPHLFGTVNLWHCSIPWLNELNTPNEGIKKSTDLWWYYRDLKMNEALQKQQSTSAETQDKQNTTESQTPGEQNTAEEKSAASEQNKQ